MNKKFYTWILIAFLAFSVSATSCSDDDPVVPPKTEDPEQPEQPDPEQPEQPDPEQPEELRFELIINDLNALGIDFEVIPSDPHAPYLTDIAPLEMVGGLSDEEFVSLLKLYYSDADTVTGQTKKRVKLDPETDYVLFAVGFLNGASTGKVAQKPFKTPSADTPSSQQAPKLEIEGAPGYNDKTTDTESAVTFTLRSDTATELVLLYDKAANIEEALMMGYLEQDLFDQYGSVFTDPEQLYYLNNSYLSVPIGELEPDTEYMLLGRVSNQHGFKISRCTARTEGSAPVKTQPEVGIEGSCGNAAGENRHCEISFTMHCTTRDAVRAACILTYKKDVDSAIGNGNSLEQLIDLNEATPFSDEQLVLLNGDEGCRFTYDATFGITPENAYTFILDVHNTEGGRRTVRADVQTEPAPKEPQEPDDHTLVMDLWCNAGDLFGNEPETAVSVGYKCLTADAVEGRIGFFPKAEWERRIAAGEKPEDILTQEGKPIASVEDFNQWGCNDTYTGLTPGTAYTAVCMAVNASGEIRCKTADGSTMGGTRSIRPVRTVKATATLSLTQAFIRQDGRVSGQDPLRLSAR